MANPNQFMAKSLDDRIDEVFPELAHLRTPRTITVPVSLDAEAFQDAVQHAIDAAAREAAARVTPTEHIRPEDVQEGDILMVPVRVTAVRTPMVGGNPARGHVYALPVAGPWGVNREGRLWTHGWTVDGALLERVVRP